MMRVLITGGLGFIGHHVIDHFLSATDWEIVTLDRIDATSTLHRLRHVRDWPKKAKRVSFVWHDLRAPINATVNRQIGPVDVALHMAASTHVDRSITEPRMFVEDNVIGTLNLLEWWRERRRGADTGRLTDISEDRTLFINFGTDEVFGPAKDGYDFKEWDRYNSANPYSAAKAGAEELTGAYSNTYGFRAVSTHTMNVFGERQHPEKFIPMTIAKISRGDTVKIHSDPKKGPGSRFYTYAPNIAAALEWLISHDIEGPRYDKWNIVGEREIDNLAMAKLIAEIVGKPLHYELADCNKERPGHDFRYALDGSKLRDTGFEYPLSLEQSLVKTINWFVENPEWLHG
jgi:dTDP-glucose 4,6-dehydratase